MSCRCCTKSDRTCPDSGERIIALRFFFAHISGSTLCATVTRISLPNFCWTVTPAWDSTCRKMTCMNQKAKKYPPFRQWRIPISSNFVMLINSIIPQKSTIYNISCRIYFYYNCFSAHCHRHTTMLLAFVRNCMRQENAPPVRGQKKSQNLLWQDKKKTFENARTVAGRGVISRVTSRTEPPFGAMSMGEPIQPRYRRVYHHHGRFVYFFCPSHQLKNRDSLLPRSSLFFCVFFQQRSRHLSGL